MALMRWTEVAIGVVGDNRRLLGFGVETVERVGGNDKNKARVEYELLARGMTPAATTDCQPDSVGWVCVGRLRCSGWNTKQIQACIAV